MEAHLVEARHRDDALAARAVGGGGVEGVGGVGRTPAEQPLERRAAEGEVVRARLASYLRRDDPPGGGEGGGEGGTWASSRNGGLWFGSVSVFLSAFSLRSLCALAAFSLCSLCVLSVLSL